MINVLVRSCFVPEELVVTMETVKYVVRCLRVVESVGVGPTLVYLFLLHWLLIQMGRKPIFKGISK